MGREKHRWGHQGVGKQEQEEGQVHVTRDREPWLGGPGPLLGPAICHLCIADPPLSQSHSGEG